MGSVINRFRKQQQQQEEVLAEAEKYLTFIIDEKYYAFPISDVKEIIEVQEITEVPEFPYYVKGVINLRNVIIPVISVRMRFHKPETEFTDRTCIVILTLDGVDAGFLVDTVEEVVDLEKRDITPVPDIMTGNHVRFIDNVGRTGKKIIMLLNGKKMLTNEQNELFDFQAAIEKQNQEDNTDAVLESLQEDNAGIVPDSAEE